MIDAASILKAASESWLTFDRIACRPFGLVAKSIKEPVLTLLFEIMYAPSMSQVAKEVAEHIGANTKWLFFSIGVNHVKGESFDH